MLKKSFIYFWVLALASLMITSMAFAKRAGYVEGDVGDAGSLSGKILFQGQPPSPIKIHLKTKRNSEFCLKNTKANGNGELLLQHVEVKGGNLKDAVVFIENITRGKFWPEDNLNINFKNCQASPKTGVVRRPPKSVTEGMLTIKNHDAGILHNPTGFSIGAKTRKMLFKKFLLSKGAEVDLTRALKYLKKGRDTHFYVECEQHLWMSVSSRIVWNPYYDISKSNGSFKIDHLPPGQYKVTVWHPYAGEKTLDITISKNATTNLDITLP